MVLHRDDRGLRAAARCVALQAHVIVKFQWQSGEKDSVIFTSEFQYRRLAKLGTSAEGGGLHGNTYGDDTGEKSRELLGAIGCAFRQCYLA